MTKLLARALAALAFAFTAQAEAALAQGFEPELTQRHVDELAAFTHFLAAYEAQFGQMPPELRQNAIAAASDAIAQGRYESFITGFRQAIGVPPGFGAMPPGGASTAPTGPGPGAWPAPGPGAAGAGGGVEAQIAGMRVFYLQRSPLGYSHASGYVHFCPGGFFHEGTEATIQNPAHASANVNSGAWRVENGPGGAVVGIYYQNGPRAGQRIEYNVSDMMAGRWMSTNWRYAVDRQAICPR